jgi:hypothetical protein
MKKAMLRTALVTCLLAIFTLGVSAQGLYWESEMSGGKTQGSGISKTWYMPKMLKIETGEDGNYAILRLDQEKLIMVHPQNKTYSVMTFAELETSMKQANAQLEKMKEQMKNMPADQRAQMEKMLGMSGGSDAKVSVKKLPDTQTVSGYACARVKIMKGTDEFADLWVTRSIKGFDAMRADLQAYSKRMASLNPRMGEDLGQAMEKIDGFPMQTTTMGITTVVKKVEPRSTPASDFAPPTGFKQVDMKEMSGK